MKRRDFIVNSVALSSLLFLEGCAGQSRRPAQKIPFNSRFLLGHEDENKKMSLLIATASGENLFIETPCKSHEVALHPINKNIVFCTSRQEKGAYLADIKLGSVIRDIEANDGEIFYGHSIFSSDGQFVFCSMINVAKGEGFISVRETKTLKEVRRISSFGRHPHQLKWSVQDKVVVIINAIATSHDSQGHSVLNFIDVQSGQLLKSFPCSTRKHGHFSITSDGNFAIACKRAVAGDITLYEKINLKNGELLVEKESPIQPGRPHIEALSHVLIEDKSIAIITVYGLDKIAIWDYKHNQMLFEQSFPQTPKGIAMSEDGKNIFANFGDGQSSVIEMYKLEKLLRFDFTPEMSFRGGNGSHLTII